MDYIAGSEYRLCNCEDRQRMWFRLYHDVLLPGWMGVLLFRSPISLHIGDVLVQNIPPALLMMLEGLLLACCCHFQCLPQHLCNTHSWNASSRCTAKTAHSIFGSRTPGVKLRTTGENGTSTEYLVLNLRAAVLIMTASTSSHCNKRRRERNTC